MEFENSSFEIYMREHVEKIVPTLGHRSSFNRNFMGNNKSCKVFFPNTRHSNMILYMTKIFITRRTQPQGVNIENLLIDCKDLIRFIKLCELSNFLDVVLGRVHILRNALREG